MYDLTNANDRLKKTSAWSSPHKICRSATSPAKLSRLWPQIYVTTRARGGSVGGGAAAQPPRGPACEP